MPFVERDIPIGTIQAWSGAIVDIPSTFRLCDGTHGTPDLRDRFIGCAADVLLHGTTGGNVNHEHGFTGDGHDHILNMGTDIGAAPGLQEFLSTDPAVGTTDAQDGRPPYYSLAYIMYAGVP